jgi:hypothetical protein
MQLMLVQETFTARTPQMVLAVLVIITVPQTQAKIIMQGTATTTTLPHITLATTTLDTDITPTQHHITEEITTLDMDITPETQDITLAHIHNRQEHHLQMLGHGHLGHSHRTTMQTPPLLHTHLFITPDTLHFPRQTTMLDSLVQML